MRTTGIDLPKDITLEAGVRRAQGKAGLRVKFPILASDQPGTLHLTNREIEDLLASGFEHV